MGIAFNGSSVDLSAQQADTYTWYDTDGNELTAGVDYKADAGKFTFLKTPAKPVYCVLESARFPKFAGSNAVQPVGTAIKGASAAEPVAAPAWFTPDGTFVGTGRPNLPAGLYVVKSGRKVTKVLVK